jgi:hypothetical protein
LGSNLYRDLENEFRAGLDDAKFIKGMITARLGDGTDAGDVPVRAADRQYPTFPLFWCYTETNGTKEIFQAVPWYPGLTYDNSQRHMEVHLVRFPMIDPKLWFIFMFSDIGLAAWNGVTPLQAGVANASVVTYDKIFPHAFYPVSGLVVGYRGGWARKLNRRYLIPGSASFLNVSTPTDYRPASGMKRWIRLAVTTAGAVSVTAGTEFDEADPSPRTHQPVTAPDGLLDLGAIMLENGMTDLVETWGAIADPAPDLSTIPSTSTSATSTYSLLASSYADRTIANTTTETALFNVAAGTTAILANEIAAGTRIRLKAAGYLSDTGTPTLTFKMKFTDSGGAATVLDSGAITLPSTITDKGWIFEADVICRSTGATGTVCASGLFMVNGAVHSLINTSDTTIDTTDNNNISATVTWGTADAANTLTAQQYTLEQFDVS